jgi:hypothetical protein
VGTEPVGQLLQGHLGLVDPGHVARPDWALGGFASV